MISCQKKKKSKERKIRRTFCALSRGYYKRKIKNI